MAIVTLDGVLAGAQPVRTIVKAASGTLVAGRPQSYWGVAGNPGAGTWDNTLNGVTLTAPVNGALAFTNPGAGNSYLARLAAAATQAGTLILADRIWHNQLTVNSTAAQNTTTPTWPARDVNAATSGDGILVGIETSAAASATAVACTMTYTNQAGTGSRTATFADATAATATISGAFFRFGLAAGDTGVRSIQTLTFSTAWTSGTINAVAYRPIAQLDIPTAGVSNSIDALTSGFPRIMDSSVLYVIFIPNTTTSTTLSGQFAVTQG